MLAGVGRERADRAGGVGELDREADLLYRPEFFVRDRDGHAAGAHMRVGGCFRERVDRRSADVLVLEQLPPFIPCALGEGAAEEGGDLLLSLSGRGDLPDVLLAAERATEVVEE